MDKIYGVTVEYDSSRDMWEVTGSNIPMMWAEARTLDEMHSKLKDEVPWLLDEHNLIPDGRYDVQFFMTIQSEGNTIMAPRKLKKGI